jgi:hypothetical protein
VYDCVNSSRCVKLCDNNNMIVEVGVLEIAIFSKLSRGS